MKEEVCAAVEFFLCFLEKSEKVPREQLSNFGKHLTDLLIERFEKHWFPDLPSKGQGYRCIRVNCLNPVDLTLELAAIKCGLRYTDLRLPTELTVWVDPSEVCYRLGESEGSYCTLASFPHYELASSRIISSSSSLISSPTSSDQCSSSSTGSSPRPLSPRTPTPPPLLLRERPTFHLNVGRRSAGQILPPVVQLQRSQQLPSTISGGGGGVRSPPSSNNGQYSSSMGGFDYNTGTPMGGGRLRTNQGGFLAGTTNNGRSNTTRQSQREMNFNSFSNHPQQQPHHNHHRPIFQRCDGPPFQMAPHFYRNLNPNRNYHKNVVRV